MRINFSTKTIPLENTDSIEEFILTVIQCSYFEQELSKYNYDMEWLREELQRIKSILEIKLKDHYRTELKNLEAERKELESKESRLAEIDQKIAKMKALKC